MGLQRTSMICTQINLWANVENRLYIPSVNLHKLHNQLFYMYGCMDLLKWCFGIILQEIRTKTFKHFTGHIYHSDTVEVQEYLDNDIYHFASIHCQRDLK